MIVSTYQGSLCPFRIRISAALCCTCRISRVSSFRINPGEETLQCRYKQWRRGMIASGGLPTATTNAAVHGSSDLNFGLDMRTSPAQTSKLHGSARRIWPRPRRTWRLRIGRRPKAPARFVFWLYRPSRSALPPDRVSQRAAAASRTEGRLTTRKRDSKEALDTDVEDDLHSPYCEPWTRRRRLRERVRSRKQQPPGCRIRRPPAPLSVPGRLLYFPLYLSISLILEVLDVAVGKSH